MDFSLEVSQEWLKRRRVMVAQASRKIRQRKKQEREVLSEENAKLKQERTALLGQISSLEQQVKAREADFDTEILRRELDQHKAFLRVLFASLGTIEPVLSSLGEVSRQNRDMALVHFDRLLDLDESWTRVVPPEVSFSQPVELGLRFCYNARGALHLRIDVRILKRRSGGGLPSPQTVCQALSRAWGDAASFEDVFGQGTIVTSRELVEFRVETEEEVLKAFHQCEPSSTLASGEAASEDGVFFRDTIYLCAWARKVMVKSALTCKEELGTALCHYAVRTVTEHGSCQDSQHEEQHIRMLKTALEGVFAWAEQDSTKVVWMFTLPKGFESFIGDQTAFVTPQGTVGLKAIFYCQKLLEYALKV